MGRAIAHLFADEGAHVAVFDRAPDGVGSVVDEITAAGGIARGWVLDLTDAGAIPVVVNDAVEMLGPVDVLVNDAGVSLATEIGGEGFEDAWATTLAVNLTAYARMV